MLAPRPNPIFSPPVNVEREMDRRPHLRADLALRVAHRAAVVDARRARTAGEALGVLPADGEAVHILISGRFALWDCVPAVVAKLGRVDRLHVATLGFNRCNVEAMGSLYDAGKLGECRLLLSHYFKGTDPELYDLAAETFEARPGMDLLSVRTHCKLLLVDAGGRKLAFESSANLRSCKNIEQLTVVGTPAVYDFHAGWIDDLFHRGAEHVRGTRPAR